MWSSFVRVVHTTQFLRHSFRARVPPISSVKPPRQHFGNEVGCFCEHIHSWIITLPSIAPVLVQVPRKEYLKTEQIKLPGQVFLLLRSGELEESKPVSVGEGGDLIVQDRYYLLQYLVQRYLLFCSDLLRRNQWVNVDHDTDTKNLLIKVLLEGVHQGVLLSLWENGPIKVFPVLCWTEPLLRQ